MPKGVIVAEEPTTDAKAEPKTVKLAVGFPVSEHHHGEYVITAEGTDVPASKAKGIIDRAVSAGANVYEVQA